MSDINEAMAIRYLIDSLNDKPFIEMAINMGLYAPALFHMEQLCEKSTKACLCTFKGLLRNCVASLCASESMSFLC